MLSSEVTQFSGAAEVTIPHIFALAQLLTSTATDASAIFNPAECATTAPTLNAAVRTNPKMIGILRLQD